MTEEVDEGKKMTKKNTEISEPLKAPQGGDEEAPVQHRSTNKRNAAFPSEVPAISRGAIDQSHTNQTHFSDLGASFGCRCPICEKTLN